MVADPRIDHRRTGQTNNRTDGAAGAIAVWLASMNATPSSWPFGEASSRPHESRWMAAGILDMITAKLKDFSSERMIAAVDAVRERAIVWLLPSIGPELSMR